jgi:hypothetical protein
LFHQGDMSGADVDVSKFQLISETDQRLVSSVQNEPSWSMFQVLNESKISLG